MEPAAVGAFLDHEEWESLNKMFSSHEDCDFMLHLHGSDLFSNQVLENGSSFEFPSNFLGNVTEENVAGGVENNASFFPSDHTLESATNFYSVSRESHSNSTTEIDKLIFPNQENVADFHDQSIRFCVMDSRNDHVNMLPVPGFPDDHVMEDILFIKEEMGNAKEMEFKRKSNETTDDEMEENSSESPKKRSRVSGDHASRNKPRITQSKKNKKVVTQNDNDELEEISNGGENGRRSSSYSSEDDCNGSQELNGGENSESKSSATLKSNGKARASRGSATDPQSLYARKRRGRINERLRILQNLVPNGTKVDISTMLEEAVHYVKFLQLQIKLLSADDLWMYAPIAYNGMDIGLCHKLCLTSWP